MSQNKETNNPQKEKTKKEEETPIPGTNREPLNITGTPEVSFDPPNPESSQYPDSHFNSRPVTSLIGRTRTINMDRFQMDIDSQTFESRPSPLTSPNAFSPTPSPNFVSPKIQIGDHPDAYNEFKNDKREILGLQNFEIHQDLDIQNDDDFSFNQTPMEDELSSWSQQAKNLLKPDLKPNLECDTLNYAENGDPAEICSIHESHLENFFQKRKPQKASEYSFAKIFATTAKIYKNSVYPKLLRRFRAVRTTKIVPEKQCDLGDMKVLTNRIRDYYINSEVEKKALYQFISFKMNFDDVYYMVGGMVAFLYFQKVPDIQMINDSKFINFFHKKMNSVFNPKTKNLAAIFSHIFSEINPITLVFHDIAVTLDYGTERIGIWLRHNKQWNLTEARKKLSQIQEITDNFKTITNIHSTKNVSIANVSYSVMTPFSFAQKVIMTPNSDFFELNSFRAYFWGESWISPISDLSRSSLLMIYTLCCNSSTKEISKLFKSSDERAQIPNYPTLLENCFYNVDNISFEDQNSKTYKIWLEDYTCTLKSKMRKSHLLKYISKLEKIYERIDGASTHPSAHYLILLNVRCQIFLAFIKYISELKFMEKETPFLNWNNNESFKKAFDLCLNRLYFPTDDKHVPQQWRERFEGLNTRAEVQKAYLLTLSEYFSFLYLDSSKKKYNAFVKILETYYTINVDGEWQGVLPSKEKHVLLEEGHFILQTDKFNRTGNVQEISLASIDPRFIDFEMSSFVAYLVLVNLLKVRREIDNFFDLYKFDYNLEHPDFATSDTGLSSFGAALSRMLDTDYEKTTGFIISGKSNSGKTFFCNKLKIIMQPLWPVESCQLNSGLNRFSSPALRGMIIHEEFKANKVNLFTNFQFAETNVTEMYAKTNRPRVKFTLDVYVMDLIYPSWEVLVKCSWGMKKGDPNKNPTYKPKIKQVQNRLSIIDTQHEEFVELMKLTKKLSVFYNNSISKFMNRRSDDSNWLKHYKKIQENYRLFSMPEVKLWSNLLGVNVVSGQPSSWDVVSEFLSFYPWFLFFRRFIAHAGKWKHVEIQNFEDEELGALDELIWN